MKRGVSVVFLVCLLLFMSLISAGEFEDEISKLTHYAEEYETGNINYAQLQIYAGATRERVSELLGAKKTYEGGILTEEQIEEVLGEPRGYTKRAWGEGEDIKLDEKVPFWQTIVFDGKKIQIRLDSWPSVYYKTSSEVKRKMQEIKDEAGMDWDPGVKKELQKLARTGEPTVVYRLNFGVEFKRPDEQIDVEEKIDEIKDLAERYRDNPTKENAEKLAKESVSVEHSFQQQVKDGTGDCEELMVGIFGAENKRFEQETRVREYEFIEGDDFFTTARLEMCDDCEWNWIGMDIWLEGLGMDLSSMDKGRERKNPDEYKDMSFDSFKSEIDETVDSIEDALSRKDFEKFVDLKYELMGLNDGWNQKANDVWKEMDEKYKKEYEGDHEGQEDYWWIKVELRKREEIKALAKKNYEIRKAFYEQLLKGYVYDETVYEQTEYELRLVEEFREFSSEKCSNNADDDDDGNIDCADDDCGGKICGRGEIGVGEGNDSKEDEVDFYCINKICQAKEESDKGGPVCGNNICEDGENDASKVCNNNKVREEKKNSESEKKNEKIEVEEGSLTIETTNDNVVESEEMNVVEASSLLTGQVVADSQEEIVETEVEEDESEIKETSLDEGVVASAIEIVKNVNIGKEDSCVGLYCPQDCTMCPKYNSMECNGKIIFSGEDKNGCQLEPICLDKNEICENSEDCTQSLCAKVECVKYEPGDAQGVCKATKIEECREEECVSGEEKIQKCDGTDDKLIASICEEGIWKKTGLICEDGGEIIEEVEEVRGEACTIASDCGGDNDVCSNGKCVSLPENEEFEKEFNENIEIKVDEKVFEENYVENNYGGDNVDGKEMEGGDGEKNDYEVKEDNRQDVGNREREVEEENRKDGEGKSFVQDMISNLVGVFRFTGRVVEGEGEGDGGEVVEEVVEDGGDDSVENDGSNEGEEDNSNDDWEDDEEDRRDREEREREKREDEERDRRQKECIEMSEKECERRFVQPCVDKCVFQEDGEMRDLEECKTECADEKKTEINDCRNDCESKCKKGEWCDIEWPDNNEGRKEQIGVFRVGGQCRVSEVETNANIFFDGWGEPFEGIHRIKEKYNRDQYDWCKWDLENLIKQREQLEKSLDEEFIEWFFEKYMSSSAEDWEQSQSGIYDMYWNIVNNQREIVNRMQCIGKDDVTELLDYELLNFSYENEFGSVEYWEEIQEVDGKYFGRKDGKVTIITPYMKIWMLPPKEFVMYEFKKAMKDQKFPGSREEMMERENKEGLTNKEKNMIREDEDFMKLIRKLSEQYGGNAQTVVEFKDEESGEVVFNLFVEINEDDLIKMTPMLPKDVPKKDVVVSVDFERLYEMMQFGSKDMEEGRIESPEWAKRKEGLGSVVKNVYNGVQMYMKVRSLINSIEVEPKDAKGDAKSVLWGVVNMMKKKDTNGMNNDDEKGGPGEGDGKMESKISGEVVRQIE